MSGALPSFYVVRVHLKTGGSVDLRFDDLGPASECLKGILARKRDNKPLRVDDGAGIEYHLEAADIGPVGMMDVATSSAAATRSVAIAALAERFEAQRLAKLGLIDLPPEPQQDRRPANGTGGGPAVPAPGSYLPQAGGAQPPFSG